MKANAYTRKIAKIDLSRKKISTEDLPESFIQDFIGGRGLNARLLYDEVAPQTHPLSPGNRIVIGAGPLSGTMAPTAGRCQCTTKSALTGAFGDSNVGGHFGAELKFAGYDHIIISGKSEKPVYLWIEDEKIELRDGRPLWGLDTWATASAIQEDLGNPDAQVLAIGPAGENLVKYSAVITNLSRAAGRGGAGAVFGSKGLKAIAVRGTRGLSVARPRDFMRSVEEYFRRISNDPGPKQRSVEGTPSLVVVMNAGGFIGYKNMQFATHDDIAEKLSAEKFLKYYSTKSKACFNCPVHCSHFYEVKDGPFAGIKGEGLEWGGILCLGIKPGVDYYPAVLKAYELANRLGFDCCSLGDMISWAMECFEKGLLTERETDGLPLHFGNYEALLLLIEKIARREGFGNVLADNIVEAAAKIGPESLPFANHIKKLTIMGDVRKGYGFALGEAVSSVGAHHVRGAVLAEEGWVARAIPDQVAEELFGSKEAKNPHSPIAKDRTVRWYERITTMADCLGLCKFVLSPYAGQKLITVKDLADLLSQASGLSFTEKDFERATERILSLERAFNVREGFSRNEDTLPPRMWEPVAGGPKKGFKLEKELFEQALKQYYELHGWNEEGIPTPETLESLNLKFVGEELERLGKYGKR